MKILFFLPLLAFGGLQDLKYTVYTESFPPYNFQDAGVVGGISTEMIRLMFEKLKLPAPKITLTGWSESYEKTIHNQTPDVVILYSILRLQERENMFKWVGPIAPFTFNLIGLVESDKKISELDDAKRFTTAVIKDDFAELFLLKNGFKLNQNLYRIPEKHEQAIERLYQGKVDFVAMAYLNAVHIARRTGHDSKQLKVYWQKDEFPFTGLFMAFSRNTPDAVIQAFADVLAQIKTSGEYVTILNKYFP
ncbi:MAG: hypothetical protein A2Y14_03965 [Verrucomicrobia bacterium GWF2_51_19]|nr:MAG: hypothetical protein A2Y14_03965 [Verrucomicrobia bacterium GWF2_51_19]HCJ11684.1 hypothetical protein [Opitutae bacterium]